MAKASSQFSDLGAVLVGGDQFGDLDRGEPIGAGVWVGGRGAWRGSGDGLLLAPTRSTHAPPPHAALRRQIPHTGIWRVVRKGRFLPLSTTGTTSQELLNWCLGRELSIVRLTALITGASSPGFRSWW